MNKFWQKNKDVKKTLLMELEPKIRSHDIDGVKHLHYGDVIKFLYDEGVSVETRTALDRATFFNHD